jgi:beta-phosphoglucomutase-like phosphatase (HAD superfamily)
MATKADKAKTKDTPQEEPVQAREAILLEFENVAFNGRQVMFDVLKSLLADKDVKLTPVMYSRYCIDRPMSEALPALLKSVAKTRGSAEKLASEASRGLQLSLTGGTAKPHETVAGLLRQAVEAGIRVGLLTVLDDVAASKLAAALGLSDEQIAALTFSRAAGTPETSDWSALAARMNMDTSLCVAVTTSQKSCFGALAAGMRCVAVPDALTEFQSFSGADVVYDAPEGLQVKEMLGLLAPRT